MYTKYTENIAKTQITIKPKVFGEPYNLEWTGNFFASIEATKSKSKIFITGESEFLKDRDESKILGLDKKSDAEIKTQIEKNATSQILGFLAT